MENKNVKMRIIQGNKHDCLVVGIYHSYPEYIKIYMVTYLKKVVINLTIEIKGHTTSPTVYRLLKVSSDEMQELEKDI